jgi:hypothetical protein
MIPVFELEEALRALGCSVADVGSYTDSMKLIHQKVVLLPEMNKQMKKISVEILEKSAHSVHIHLLVFIA